MEDVGYSMAIQLIYLMVTWYIFPFCYLVPRKNLATLVCSCRFLSGSGLPPKCKYCARVADPGSRIYAHVSRIQDPGSMRHLSGN
jgi:hypothetical protein